jgi:tRNA nucleotidyltransferase (CCA-adding enzyme)
MAPAGGPDARQGDRRQATPPFGRDLEGSIPAGVRELFDRLRAAGHAAYVVGGSLRDLLLGREPGDWDLATDARPPQILALVPGALYENAFGTVVARTADGQMVEITTFRSDHEYADFRRPHRVEFGDHIEADLARRDFTCNAIAWGGPPDVEPGLVDPFGGRDDVERRLLRTVGDPATRFGEDALRMLRAVRLAAVLHFAIEPATLEGIESCAPLAGHLSGERVAAEVGKLLAADRPSVGLHLAMDAGLIAIVAPLLAAQRGVAQNKVPGDDCWAHTVRAVDAAAAAGCPAIVRLAVLLHDIGKPATAADGHFYGHEAVGAEQAADLLRGWHVPRATVDRVVHLVRHHMFAYDAAWSDGAVRKFIVKVGRGALDDLFALREADSVGSGLPADAGGLAELRARVAHELAANAALDRAGLAVRGDDLVAGLGLEPGPLVGRLLEALVERVVADPALNEPDRLLGLARELARSKAEHGEDG